MSPEDSPAGATKGHGKQLLQLCRELVHLRGTGVQWSQGTVGLR
jgi:hypothetical protein